MEGLMRSLAGQARQSCILRGGGFVGPGTGREKVSAELRVGRLVVEGSGRNCVSLIHMADMAALQAAPAGSGFKIVAEPIRHGEDLDRLADALGAPRRGTAACPRRPPGAAPRSWPAASRAGVRNTPSSPQSNKNNRPGKNRGGSF